MSSRRSGPAETASVGIGVSGRDAGSIGVSSVRGSVAGRVTRKRRENSGTVATALGRRRRARPCRSCGGSRFERRSGATRCAGACRDRLLACGGAARAREPLRDGGRRAVGARAARDGRAVDTGPHTRRRTATYRACRAIGATRGAGERRAATVAGTSTRRLHRRMEANRPTRRSLHAPTRGERYQSLARSSREPHHRDRASARRRVDTQAHQGPHGKAQARGSSARLTEHGWASAPGVLRGRVLWCGSEQSRGAPLAAVADRRPNQVRQSIV